MLYIQRKKYIEKLLEFRKTRRLILLTGMQGAGKKSILEDASHSLKNEKPPVRILHITEEDEITAGRELVSAARALGVGRSALFVDTGDAIAELPGAIAEILSKYSVTVFVTGRNSSRLESILSPAFGDTGSRELAVIRVNPFSYREFLEAWELAESREALTMYCRVGGLPLSMMVDPRSPDSREFTRLRANSFILTEIVEPAAIRNPSFLRTLLETSAKSAGENLSARQIRDAFALERITISPQAVLDYFKLCSDSGILVSMPTIDIEQNRRIDTSEAWYFGDAGLRSAFGGKETLSSLSRTEENLAFLRLVDDGWNVSRGRTGRGRQMREEISFVCERDGKRIYVQMIPGTATAGERLRKRSALLGIRDAWPKYLVDTDIDENARDGINRIYIRDLLSGGIENQEAAPAKKVQTD